MVYENVKEGVFLSRPNRFIAHVQVEGQEQICHVKNTGRCRELLTPGACVLLQDAGENTGRKTRYDLISVWKGNRLINMDSQAPNKLFREWLPDSGFFRELTQIRPETKHGDSRFDFYLEGDGRRVFVEVKGVTLEDEGVVRFPDAPTERGVKHLNGLAACVREGFEAWAVFVVQMSDVKWLEPNWATHPAFGQALLDACNLGVKPLALSCRVEPGQVWIQDRVPIRLENRR